MLSERGTFPIDDTVASQVLGGEFDGPSDTHLSHVQERLGVGEIAALLIIEKLEEADIMRLEDQLAGTNITL